jgi:nucleoside-diphosphate-sugar epimerase
MNALPVHQVDWAYYTRLLETGTAACAQAAGLAGVKLLVHTSSAFAYGDTHGDIVDESVHLSHDTALFAAVSAGEAAALNGTVPACVLRAGFNYGPGSDSLEALHRALINRSRLDLGDGENAAAWVHEADLARAIVLAVEQQPAGEVFNIADTNTLSPLEFASRFADTLGVPALRQLKIPSSFRQFMTDATARAILETSVRLSSAKARESLGWTPQYTTIEGGLEQTLLVWRAAQPA